MALSALPAVVRVRIALGAVVVMTILIWRRLIVGLNVCPIVAGVAAYVVVG